MDLNKALITVKLQSEDRTVSFAPTLNPFFDHGWAMTIHKAQEEINPYMTTLEEHQSVFHALHGYNPRLIQQAQEVFKDQDHHLERMRDLALK